MLEGALTGLSAIELRDLAIRDAVHRMTLNPSQTDECLIGCVLVAGLKLRLARALAQQLEKDASLWKSRP
jgi:hypothetical protein